MTDPTSFRPVNPATGEALAPVPVTSPEEVIARVEHARAARQVWANTPLEERIEHLAAFARRLSDRDTADGLARLVSMEMGKPIKHARAEVRTVAGRTGTFFDRVREASREEVAREGSIEVVTQWRPLGVVAVIGPWNYPVATPHNLVASALLTGNTCVLKPSEITPRTGARYAELLGEGLPPGVLEVVQGPGTTGAALVDAAVDMVAFTGSIRTGQAIMRAAASGMKRLVLELGGKDPMVVLPGADVEAAAAHAVRAALTNSGQVCVAAERILVHSSVHDEFLAQVQRRVAELVVGDPGDEETDMGPMASEEQRRLVEAQLEDAVARGARMVLRGRKRDPGFFLEPSIVDDVTAEMKLGSDETFGPVVALERFETAEQAVARANATHYGLGASVWGPPGPETDAVAARMEAGMVGINRGLTAAAGAPWVGWKMSGLGYSRSVDGMRQFMVPRTLSRNV